MATTYVLLNSATVSNSTTTSVSLSSISQSYTDLVLRASVRNDTGYAFWVDGITVGPSGSYTRISGNGSSPASSRNTGSNLFDQSAVAQSATANTFSVVEAYIPNYSLTTSTKPWFAFSGVSSNSGTADNSFVNAFGRLTTASTAISTINISPWNSSYIALGSSFYLYGIKNS